MSRHIILRRNPLSVAVAAAFGWQLEHTILAMPDPLTPNQRFEIGLLAQAPAA